ncbi:hypothetical protein BLNAU_321 [Blattamonas nauphoetae]|uniref:Uncharacterized protein n=1 Tax=Blattamonas nauphoetae TaxID=2049346 RepID=A0ABQ9YKX7_9EUKA|nr:hypothetical protein BLNAU_321 [Blattamonas nauphoetae]
MKTDATQDSQDLLIAQCVRKIATVSQACESINLTYQDFTKRICNSLQRTLEEKIKDADHQILSTFLLTAIPQITYSPLASIPKDLLESKPEILNSQAKLVISKSPKLFWTVPKQTRQQILESDHQLFDSIITSFLMDYASVVVAINGTLDYSLSYNVDALRNITRPLANIIATISSSDTLFLRALHQIETLSDLHFLPRTISGHIRRSVAYNTGENQYIKRKTPAAQKDAKHSLFPTPRPSPSPLQTVSRPPQNQSVFVSQDDSHIFFAAIDALQQNGSIPEAFRLFNSTFGPLIDPSNTIRTLSQTDQSKLQNLLKVFSMTISDDATTLSLVRQVALQPPKRQPLNRMPKPVMGGRPDFGTPGSQSGANIQKSTILLTVAAEQPLPRTPIVLPLLSPLHNTFLPVLKRIVELPTQTEGQWIFPTPTPTYNAQLNTFQLSSDDRDLKDAYAMINSNELCQTLVLCTYTNYLSSFAKNFRVSGLPPSGMIPDARTHLLQSMNDADSRLLFDSESPLFVITSNICSNHPYFLNTLLFRIQSNEDVLTATLFFSFFYHHALTSSNALHATLSFLALHHTSLAQFTPTDPFTFYMNELRSASKRKELGVLRGTSSGLSFTPHLKELFVAQMLEQCPKTDDMLKVEEKVDAFDGEKRMLIEDTTERALEELMEEQHVSLSSTERSLLRSILTLQPHAEYKRLAGTKTEEEMDNDQLMDLLKPRPGSQSKLLYCQLLSTEDLITLVETIHASPPD